MSKIIYTDGISKYRPGDVYAGCQLTPKLGEESLSSLGLAVWTPPTPTPSPIPPARYVPAKILQALSSDFRKEFRKWKGMSDENEDWYEELLASDTISGDNQRFHDGVNSFCTYASIDEKTKATILDSAKL